MADDPVDQTDSDALGFGGCGLLILGAMAALIASMGGSRAAIHGDPYMVPVLVGFWVTVIGYPLVVILLTLLLKDRLKDDADRPLGLTGVLMAAILGAIVLLALAAAVATTVMERKDAPHHRGGPAAT